MDTTTLYKLMILYMLKRVNYPLINVQISTFFLNKGYTTYFVLQEVLTDMVNSKYIETSSYNNADHYEITPHGEETLKFFDNKLSLLIKSDIDEYLRENKYEFRNENMVTADYFQGTNSDYIAHLCVREENSTLLEINIACVNAEQASTMCSKWKDASPDIYKSIIKALS